MNILIIDHQKNLHQFHAHKAWSRGFIQNFKFLSATPAERQALIEQIPLDADERPQHKVSLLDPQAIAQIPEHNLAPSYDYGITLIDCLHKKIISVNEYSHLNSLIWGNVRNLLSPRFAVDNKKEELDNYHQLFKHKYIDMERELSSKILAKIEYVLNLPNPYEFEGYSQTRPEDMFLFHHIDCPLSTKNTGWTIQSTTSYIDLSFYKNMFLLLEKNKIVLTSKQLKIWNTFVNDQLAEQDIDNKDAFQKIVDEIKIQKEKKKLEKQIQPASSASLTNGLEKQFKI